MHTSLTEVITLYLQCSIPTVLFWLLFFYFLEQLQSNLVFQKNISNLLVFGPCNLEGLSTLQKHNIFCQNLIPEFFQVFQPFSLLFLFYILFLLSLLLYLGLSSFFCLLYSLLNLASFYYLFQANLELLLLFMSLQYFLILLFKHCDISLEDI